MTPEQKMQVVVEATGKCWHESDFGMSICKHCRRTNDPRYFDFDKVNPSPIDLNELFRLAEKLEIHVHLKYRIKDYHIKVWFLPGDDEEDRVFFWAHSDNAAEVLLNALYEAVRER